MTKKFRNTREAVGVFHNFNEMQKAIAELEISGFERRHISVLGSETAMREKFGRTQEKPEQLENHPEAPRSPNVAPEEVGVAQGVIVVGSTAIGIAAAAIASGGFAIPGAAITSVIVGGVGGTVVGGILAKVLGDKYADFFQKQIDKGGLLLWVQTENAEKEKKHHMF